VNRERPHVLILPEDAANRDIANGFALDVDHERALQVLPVQRGWTNVRDALRQTFVPELRRYRCAHLVALIDFDSRPDRCMLFTDELALPADIAERVFIAGALTEVEDLRRSLVSRRLISPNTLEGIGEALAEECRTGGSLVWGDELLTHNAVEVARMRTALRPILFN
jgi:hypothetical protein